MSDVIIGMTDVKTILEDPAVLFVDTYLDKFKPDSPEGKLLSVFAYGTWKDYKDLEGSLPQNLKLQPDSNSYKKIKKLTLLSIFAKHQVTKFQFLKREIAIDSDLELESLVIDLIANDFLDAKIDERTKTVVCARCAARCVKNEKSAIMAQVEQIRTIRKNIASALALANP